MRGSFERVRGGSFERVRVRGNIDIQMRGSFERVRGGSPQEPNPID